MNPETGEFKHYLNRNFKDRIWLDEFDSFGKILVNGVLEISEKSDESKPNYEKLLAEAEKVVQNSVKIALRRFFCFYFLVKIFEK